jgi:hypothetical protein
MPFAPYLNHPGSQIVHHPQLRSLLRQLFDPIEIGCYITKRFGFSDAFQKVD